MTAAKRKKHEDECGEKLLDRSELAAHANLSVRLIGRPGVSIPEDEMSGTMGLSQFGLADHREVKKRGLEWTVEFLKQKNIVLAVPHQTPRATLKTKYFIKPWYFSRASPIVFLKFTL